MKLIYALILTMVFNQVFSQIYVDIDAVGGANDGSSWTDAYTSLNTALNNALAGDEIWVAEGIYIPNAHPRDISGSPALTDRDFTFHLVNGVGIYGGFNGTESSKSQRNVNGFPTILSGEIDDQNTVYSIHVVLSVSDNSSTILDGFTITKGLPISPTDPPITVEGQVISRQNGAGMYSVNSNPGLDSLTFFENVILHGYGGGMYNDASSPEIKNTTFDTNYAYFGAGMCNVNGSNPIILNVDLIDNNGVRGVGMYNDHSSPTLTSCTIERNVLGSFNNYNNLTTDGAGMFNINASTPTLNLVIFKTNQSGNGNGAGMYNNSSNPLLINCLFQLNLSADDGAGMYNLSSNPTLNHVEFIFNFAGQDGGGIYNLNSSPTLVNVKIGGGNATQGGGILNNNSAPIITGGTISSNYAERGGGVCNINVSAPELTNVIIRNNKITEGGSIINDKVGGGMCNIDSSPILEGVTISNNTAILGGGISNWNSSPTLNNVTIENNKAFLNGGGMNIDSTSSPILCNVLFENNQTRHTEQSLEQQTLRSNRGGGMHVDNNSIPTLTNVTFNNNEASYGGGMSLDNGSNAILNNVTFRYNEARDGGGLFNLDSSPSIRNVVFDGNRARSFTSVTQFLFYYDEEFLGHKGGGIYTESLDPFTLTNVVFNNNIAEGDSFIFINIQNQIAVKNIRPIAGKGGGIYHSKFSFDSLITVINGTFKENNVGSSGIFPGKGEAIYNNTNGKIGIHNSIISRDFFGVSYSELDGINGPTSISGTNNLIDNTSSFIFDRYFVDRTLPSGLDDTWGTADDGLRPAYGGSIINSGNNSFNGVPVDITGQSRIIGGTIDIGAYEFTECNGTTEYISGNWTNGPPTPSMNAVFRDDYNTLDPGNGTILACTCTVEVGKTLTIGDKTALHVYFNGINIFGSVIVEEGGSIINGIWSGQ